MPSRYVFVVYTSDPNNIGGLPIEPPNEYDTEKGVAKSVAESPVNPAGTYSRPLER